MDRKSQNISCADIFHNCQSLWQKRANAVYKDSTNYLHHIISGKDKKLYFVGKNWLAVIGTVLVKPDGKLVLSFANWMKK